MADVPKDLLSQIKEFEDIFTVDKQKLKEVVAHFVKELEKGVYYIANTRQPLSSILIEFQFRSHC